MNDASRSVPRTLTRTLSVCLAAWLLAGQPAAAATENLYQQSRDLQAQYARDLEKLAAWCETEGLAAEAKTTRAALGPHDPYKLYVPVLPRQVGPARLPEGTPPKVVHWHEQLSKLRHDQAAALYDLAQRAIGRHQASLAWALILKAVSDDPDHEAARRLLGYQKYQDGWYKAYEVKKLRAGQVWDEKFGWLPESQVERYRQGQRLLGGRWISAEEDARRHHDIHSGWEIETEHYTVRTDHSMEAAVGLGVQLENLYGVWQQIFIRYYANEAYLAGLFGGHAAGQPAHGPEPHRFSVVYFRDRDDYNRSLRAMPKPEMSLGVYVAEKRTAYFFAGDRSDLRTVNHEATHQLFYQSRRGSPKAGKKANFWIIEGIALLMESLRQQDGYFVLGGMDDVRVSAARYHLKTGDYYVPFAELVGYGEDRVQRDPKIMSLYSQAAGMTHFLMFYEGGRYRDALVAYLSNVYNGQDDLETLSRLTGSSYSDLDKQYRAYMRVDPP